MSNRKFQGTLRGGRGVRIHWDRDESEHCPACNGVAQKSFVTCRYCGSTGLVSHKRRETIELLLASKTTPMIGGGQSDE